MRMAAWRCGIAGAAFILVPWMAMAQEQKDKRVEIPNDEPGPVHKQLAPLAGSWDVDITYVINGKEHKGKVRCEAKWILDGRFLQQDYQSTLAGKPFYVLQLIGYDNRRKKTIEIMLDSRSTGVMHGEGSIDKDGKVITNHSEFPDPVSGKNVKLRTVTTIIDQDHYTLEWFHTVEDGKEEKGVSMSHARRKPEDKSGS